MHNSFGTLHSLEVNERREREKAAGAARTIHTLINAIRCNHENIERHLEKLESELAIIREVVGS